MDGKKAWVRIGVVILVLILAPAVYSASPKRDYQQTIAERDGNYVKYDNLIVYDEKTGLEWLMGPDRGITWESAGDWIKTLHGDGKKWRMPTVDELKTIYHKDRGTRNMTPLLATTGWFLWSGQKKSLYILIMDFKTGSQNEFWCYGSCNMSNFRAIAVRSAK